MIRGPYLTSSEAARRLGISAKALRLYERRKLLRPDRTAAGWRIYGPDDMDRAREIVSLRDIGLSLDEIGHILLGSEHDRGSALAAHQASLGQRAGRLAASIDKLWAVRGDPKHIVTAIAHDSARPARPNGTAAIGFDLPWPWGGERFELPELSPLTYITGPLGSGKTRLAEALAAALPNAAFIGLDRLAVNGSEKVSAKVEDIVRSLIESGGTASPALLALLTAMESQHAAALVIDLIEQGLDAATQAALGAYLLRRGSNEKPLLVMTRSTAILNLTALTPEHRIIFCPANHSPPRLVAASPGAQGYEAVVSCLASPDVRARTEGVIAWRAQRA